MVKIIGCLLVLISGGSLGFYKSYQEKRKLQQGYDLKRFLYLLEGEIRYGFSPLPDAFEQIEKKVGKEIMPFLNHLANALKQYQAEQFYTIWKQRINIDLEPVFLEKRLLEPLIRLGETMGYLDQEMQLKTIAFTMEQLEDMIYELKDNVKKNCKMYQILGLSLGFFVIIFLI